MSVIGLLVWVVVFCLAVWAVRALMAAFGVGEPISTVVYVLLVVFVILWLVGLLNGGNLGTIRIGRG